MNNKIKILFLHTGAELYGSDRILLSIVSNLDKKKYEALVVLPKAGPLVNELKKNGVRVRVVSYPIIRRKIFNPVGMVNYAKEYKNSCRKLLKIVQDEDIEIVHSNTVAVLEGIYLKKRSKIVLISHIHEMIESPKFVARFLYGIHVKYADRILCVSNAVKKHIEKSVRINSKKLVVIHNGIKPIEKEKTDFRKVHSIPENAEVFAVIGRINAIKGQDDFIDAIKGAREENGNLYGLIVGDAFSGQEWRIDKMKAKISECGLDKYIKYVGFIEDTEKVYSAMDVLVLPSVQSDSFPTVVLEAMSCGIPTIAYKCGGVEEMIKDGENGYLVDMHDVKTLSRKMASISPSEMYDNCVSRFQSEFSLEKFMYNIDRLYSDLVSESRAK